MNKRIKRRKFIGTSIITMLILILCSYSYLAYDTFVGYDINFKKEIDVPYNLIMYRIDEIKEQNKNYWDNPSICYEIGSMYEMIFLFDEATKYYVRSIEKAPRKYFLPHFKLARLYMYRGKLDDAAFIMNIIPNINNKKLKQEKGSFWEDMSVRYANKKQIDEALKCIKKAMLYYKSIDTDKFNELKEDEAYLLVLQSEKLVDAGELKEAMDILETAQKMNGSAELSYRLAILNYKNDNKKAFKYFEQTQETNPSIINYDIYYNLINSLIKEAEANKNFSEKNFYQQKLSMLKKYVNSTFISKDEFLLENINASLKKHLLGKKKEVIVNFDIYNNTPLSFRELYAFCEVTVGEQKFAQSVSVKNPKNVILPYSSIKNNKIKVDISKLDNPKNKDEEDKISGKLYLYKNPKFNKSEIGKFEL